MRIVRGQWIVGGEGVQPKVPWPNDTLEEFIRRNYIRPRNFNPEYGTNHGDVLDE